jgi:uracil-DNA glycosylase family 4
VPSSPDKAKVAARALGARCNLCPLKDRVAVAPSAPSKGLSLILVGEAPGRVEEKLGAPFMGQSGQLVNRLLASEAKVPRQATYLTNAALCRGESDRDNEAAAKFCAPRLLRELSSLPRNVPIAPLGKAAVNSVLGLSKILLTRGFIWTLPEVAYEDSQAKISKTPPGLKRKLVELRYDTLRFRHKLAGRVALPSIHPAFVLRSESWHPVIRADFRRIGRAVRGEIKKLDSEGGHLVTQDVRKLYSLGPIVSLDVETTKAKSPLLAELLCVGLGDGKREIVIWPWLPRLAKALAKFLATRREVVGHNLIGFDKVVLEQAGIK